MLNAPIAGPGLARLAAAIRLRAAQMVAPHGFGYLGQALSAAEQYAAVYGGALRPGVDRVVCSPGHYVIAAYAAAAGTGLLDPAVLGTYGMDGSALPAIGGEGLPVPDFTCGSLGQGLSAAAGFALADRLLGRAEARTFAFVSDGELEEGQVWEAAMFAGHHRLARLTVLLDANNSQVDGPLDGITTIEPVAAKWRSFGWDAADLDGHDAGAVAAALAKAAGATRPQVLICRTSTRHGLACLPEGTDGHFIKLPPELAEAAITELTPRAGAPANRQAGRQQPAKTAPAKTVPAETAPGTAARGAAGRRGPGGAGRRAAGLEPSAVLAPPFRTVLKPYGRALAELARGRPEIVCLSGDLTRQCEVDLFQAEFGDRFIQAGMAEANMISVAGALARSGLIPFVHSFGVFLSRRAFDQIVNAVACPGLPVRLVGFMPGISSPGGPSHQAIEDMALMRALPGMTVVDVADATQTAQAVAAVADVPGPVYLRLKRGEIPVIFPPEHRFRLDRAQVLAPAGAAEPEGAGVPGDAEVAVFACGMMVAPALAAVAALRAAGTGAVAVNVPVVAPLDAGTVLPVAAAAGAVVTAENHTVTGGLGSAVAEALAEAGLGRPLRRVGLATFAEAAQGAPYLFQKYGLTTQHIVDAAWSALARPGPPPRAPAVSAQPGEYAPV